MAGPESSVGGSICAGLMGCCTTTIGAGFGCGGGCVFALASTTGAGSCSFIGVLLQPPSNTTTANPDSIPISNFRMIKLLIESQMQLPIY